MTAAFASLKREELPDATPQMHVVMRVGGSLGTAVLAVVLQRAFVSAPRPRPMRSTSPSGGRSGCPPLAIIPAVVLVALRARRPAAAAAEPVAMPVGERLAESAA